MGAIFGTKTKRKHYKTKQAEQETYYDDISKSQRSFVFWLDELINNPNEIINMHRNHIHLIEMRALTAYNQPFHKNKKINKWIIGKIDNVVKIHRINELNAKV